jgi:hypothetical protein
MDKLANYFEQLKTSNLDAWKKWEKRFDDAVKQNNDAVWNRVFDLGQNNDTDKNIQINPLNYVGEYFFTKEQLLKEFSKILEEAQLITNKDGFPELDAPSKKKLTCLLQDILNEAWAALFRKKRNRESFISIAFPNYDFNNETKKELLSGYVQTLLGELAEASKPTNLQKNKKFPKVHKDSAAAMSFISQEIRRDDDNSIINHFMREKTSPTAAISINYSPSTRLSRPIEISPIKSSWFTKIIGAVMTLGMSVYLYFRDKKTFEKLDTATSSTVVAPKINGSKPDLSLIPEDAIPDYFGMQQKLDQAAEKEEKQKEERTSAIPASSHTPIISACLAATPPGSPTQTSLNSSIVPEPTSTSSTPLSGSPGVSRPASPTPTATSFFKSLYQRIFYPQNFEVEIKSKKLTAALALPINNLEVEADSRKLDAALTPPIKGSENYDPVEEALAELNGDVSTNNRPTYSK